MSKTRIYCVTDGENKHLVEAASASQALMIVVKGLFKVEVASSKVVAELMTKGIKIESGAEQSH